MPPAFLVDGLMEKEILKRLCPGSPAIRMDLNGRDVEVFRIAELAISKIRALGGRYWPIVVVVDREHRQMSAEEMERQLVEIIRAELPNETVRVIVADRCVENWILHDSILIRERLGIDVGDRTDDGGTKADLKKLLRPAKYHETTLGVELFCAVRVSRIATSPSLRKLQLAIDFACHWNNR